MVEINVNQQGLVTLFKFDLLPKNQPRSLWVHKNDSLDYGSQDSYPQPVIPVCINDRITLSLNMYNGEFLDYGEMHKPK